MAELLIINSACERFEILSVIQMLYEIKRKTYNLFVYVCICRTKIESLKTKVILFISFFAHSKYVPERIFPCCRLFIKRAD